MFNKSGLVNQMVRIINDEALEVSQNPVTWRETLRYSRNNYINKFVRIAFIITAVLAAKAFFYLLHFIAQCYEPIFCQEIQYGSHVANTYFAFYIYQIVVVTFIAPAFLAIVLPRGNLQSTFELLLTTSIPSRKIINGKIAGTMPYLVILVLPAALGMIGPIGVTTITETPYAPPYDLIPWFIISQAVIVINTLFILMLTIFLSIRFKSPLNALMITYFLMIVLQAIIWYLPLLTNALFDQTANGIWASISFVTTMFWIVEETIYQWRFGQFRNWGITIAAHILLYGFGTFSLYRLAIHRLNQLRG